MAYQCRYYVLDDLNQVTQVEDVRTWGEFFTRINSRRVDSTILEGVHVSTVFLGIDHNFGGGGPPLLFETMIFGGDHDGYCRRYPTWDEAEAGHEAALVKVQRSTKKLRVVKK